MENPTKFKPSLKGCVSSVTSLGILLASFLHATSTWTSKLAIERPLDPYSMHSP